MTTEAPAVIAKEEWSSMTGLTRRRTTTAKPANKQNEWPTMRNLGAFMRRKSSAALNRNGPKQLTWKGTFSADKRARELEAELVEVRRAADEKVADLELRVASRDAVLRRRAVAMASAEEAMSALESRATELEDKLKEAENRNRVLEKEIAELDETLKIRDDEIERTKSVNKRRPVQAVARTIALAGTGAMVVLASAGAR